MISLSHRTEVILKKYFPAQQEYVAVRDRLINQCADNIPGCENSTPDEMDRIRFSVLKLSSGDAEKLLDAIQLAVTDWRDLFIAAGFGYDIEQHNKWYDEQNTEQ